MSLDSQNISFDNSNSVSCAQLLPFFVVGTNNNRNNNKNNSSKDLHELIVNSLTHFSGKLWLDAQLTTNKNEDSLNSTLRSFDIANNNNNDKRFVEVVNEEKCHHGQQKNVAALNRHESSSSSSFISGLLSTLEVYITQNILTLTIQQQQQQDNNTSNNNQEQQQLLDLSIRSNSAAATTTTTTSNSNTSKQTTATMMIQSLLQLSCQTIEQVIDSVAKQLLADGSARSSHDGEDDEVAGETASAECYSSPSQTGLSEEMSKMLISTLDRCISSAFAAFSAATTPSTSTGGQGNFQLLEQNLRNKLTKLSFSLARACGSISLLIEFLIENNDINNNNSDQNNMLLDFLTMRTDVAVAVDDIEAQIQFQQSFDSPIQLFSQTYFENKLNENNSNGDEEASANDEKDHQENNNSKKLMSLLLQHQIPKNSSAINVTSPKKESNNSAASAHNSIVLLLAALPSHSNSNNNNQHQRQNKSNIFSLITFDQATNSLQFISESFSDSTSHHWNLVSNWPRILNSKNNITNIKNKSSRQPQVTTRSLGKNTCDFSSKNRKWIIIPQEENTFRIYQADIEQNSLKIVEVNGEGENGNNVIEFSLHPLINTEAASSVFIPSAVLANNNAKPAFSFLFLSADHSDETRSLKIARVINDSQQQQSKIITLQRTVSIDSSKTRKTLLFNKDLYFELNNYNLYYFSSSGTNNKVENNHSNDTHLPAYLKKKQQLQLQHQQKQFMNENTNFRLFRNLVSCSLSFVLEMWVMPCSLASTGSSSMIIHSCGKEYQLELSSTSSWKFGKRKRNYSSTTETTNNNNNMHHHHHEFMNSEDFDIVSIAFGENDSARNLTVWNQWQHVAIVFDNSQSQASASSNDQNNSSNQRQQQRLTLLVTSSEGTTRSNSILISTTNSPNYDFLEDSLATSWKIGHSTFYGHLAEFKLRVQHHQQYYNKNKSGFFDRYCGANDLQLQIMDIKRHMNVSSSENSSNKISELDSDVCVYIPFFSFFDQLPSENLLLDFSRNGIHGIAKFQQQQESLHKTNSASSSLSSITFDEGNVMNRLPVNYSSTTNSSPATTMKVTIPDDRNKMILPSCIGFCMSQSNDNYLVLTPSCPKLASSSVDPTFVLSQYDSEGFLIQERSVSFQASSSSASPVSSSSYTMRMMNLTVVSMATTSSSSLSSATEDLLICFRENIVVNSSTSKSADDELHFVLVRNIQTSATESANRQLQQNVAPSSNNSSNNKSFQQILCRIWLNHFARTIPVVDDLPNLIELLECSFTTAHLNSNNTTSNNSQQQTISASRRPPSALPILLDHIIGIVGHQLDYFYPQQSHQNTPTTSSLLLTSSQIYSVVESMHSFALLAQRNNNNNNNGNFPSAQYFNGNSSNPVTQNLSGHQQQSLQLLSLSLRLYFFYCCSSPSSGSSSSLEQKIKRLMFVTLKRYISPMQIPALCFRLASLFLKNYSIPFSSAAAVATTPISENKNPITLFFSMLLNYFSSKTNYILSKIFSSSGTPDNKTALRVQFQFLFSECCKAKLNLFQQQNQNQSESSSPSVAATTLQVASFSSCPDIFMECSTLLSNIIRTCLSLCLANPLFEYQQSEQQQTEKDRNLQQHSKNNNNNLPPSASSSSSPELLEFLLMMLTTTLKLTTQTLSSSIKIITASLNSNTNNNNNNNFFAKPSWIQRLEAVKFFLVSSTSSNNNNFFNLGSYVRLSLITIYKLSEFLGPIHGQQCADAVSKFRDVLKDCSEGININNVNSMIEEHFNKNDNNSAMTTMKDTVSVMRDIDSEICLVLATITCDLVWNSSNALVINANTNTASNNSATTHASGISASSQMSSYLLDFNHHNNGDNNRSASTGSATSTLPPKQNNNNNVEITNFASSTSFSPHYLVSLTTSPVIIRKVEKLLQLPGTIANMGFNNNNNNSSRRGNHNNNSHQSTNNFGLLFSRGFQRPGCEREILLRNFLSGFGLLYKITWEEYYEKQFPAPASFKQNVFANNYSSSTNGNNNEQQENQASSTSSASQSSSLSLNLLERSIFAAMANVLLPTEILKNPPSLLASSTLSTTTTQNNNIHINNNAKKYQSLIKQLLSSVNSLRSWLMLMRQTALSDVPEIFSRATLLCKVESAEVVVRLFDQNINNNNNQQQGDQDSSPVVDVVTANSLKAFEKVGNQQHRVNRLVRPGTTSNTNSNNVSASTSSTDANAKQFRQMYASWKEARRTRHLLSTTAEVMGGTGAPTATTTTTATATSKSSASSSSSSSSSILLSSLFHTIRSTVIDFIQFDECKYFDTNQYVVLSREVEAALHRRSRGAQARLGALASIRHLLLSGGVFAVASSGLLAAGKIAKCFSGRHVLEPVLGGTADSVMRARGALSQLLVDVCLKIDRNLMESSSNSSSSVSFQKQQKDQTDQLVQVLIALISCQWTRADFWQWPVPALPKILAKLSGLQKFIEHHHYHHQPQQEQNQNIKNDNIAAAATVNGLPPLAESALVGDCSSSLLVSPRDRRTVRWTAGRGTCFGSVAWRSCDDEQTASRQQNNQNQQQQQQQQSFSDIHYFECSITEVQSGGSIAVGLASPRYSLTRPLGWDAGSIALHTEDGAVYCESSQGRQFIAPLAATLLGGNSCIVGCGIIWRTNEVFFTLNGALVGLKLSAPAFSATSSSGNAAGAGGDGDDETFFAAAAHQRNNNSSSAVDGARALDGSCYPAVSLDVQATVRINFGGASDEPFAFGLLNKDNLRSLFGNNEAEEIYSNILLMMTMTKQDSHESENGELKMNDNDKKKKKRKTHLRSLSPRPLYEQSWDAYRHWIVHLVGVLISSSSSSSSQPQQQTVTADASSLLRLSELVSSTLQSLYEEWYYVIYKSLTCFLDLMNHNNSKNKKQENPSSALNSLVTLLLNSKKKKNPMSAKSLFDFLFSRFTDLSEMICLCLQACRNFISINHNNNSAPTTSSSTALSKQQEKLQKLIQDIYSSVFEVAKSTLSKTSLATAFAKKKESDENVDREKDDDDEDDDDPVLSSYYYFGFSATAGSMGNKNNNATTSSSRPRNNHHQDVILSTCWTMWFNLCFVASPATISDFIPLMLQEVSVYTQFCTVRASEQYAHRARQLQVAHQSRRFDNNYFSNRQPQQKLSNPKIGNNDDNVDDDGGETKNENGKSEKNSSLSSTAASIINLPPSPPSFEPSALTAAIAIYDILLLGQSPSSSSSRVTLQLWSNHIIATFSKEFEHHKPSQASSSSEKHKNQNDDDSDKRNSNEKTSSSEERNPKSLALLSAISFVLTGQARSIPIKGSVVILHGSLLFSSSTTSSSSSASSATADNTTNVNQQQLRAKSNKNLYFVKSHVDNEMGIAEVFTSDKTRFGKQTLCVSPLRLEVWKDVFGLSISATTASTTSFEAKDDVKSGTSPRKTKNNSKNEAPSSSLLSKFLSEQICDFAYEMMMDAIIPNNSDSSSLFKNLEDKLLLTWMVQVIGNHFSQVLTFSSHFSSSSPKNDSSDVDSSLIDFFVSTCVKFLEASSSSSNSINSNASLILPMPHPPSSYSRLKLDMDEEDFCFNILLPFFGSADVENRPRGEWNNGFYQPQRQSATTSTANKKEEQQKSEEKEKIHHHNKTNKVINHNNRRGSSTTNNNLSTTMQGNNNNSVNNQFLLRPFVPAYLGSVRIGVNNNNSNSNNNTNSNNSHNSNHMMALDLSQRSGMPIEICTIALEETNYDRSRALRLLLIQRHHEQNANSDSTDIHLPIPPPNNNDDDDDDDGQDEDDQFEDDHEGENQSGIIRSGGAISNPTNNLNGDILQQQQQLHRGERRRQRRRNQNNEHVNNSSSNMNPSNHHQELLNEVLALARNHEQYPRHHSSSSNLHTEMVRQIDRHHQAEEEEILRNLVNNNNNNNNNNRARLSSRQNNNNNANRPSALSMLLHHHQRQNNNNSLSSTNNSVSNHEELFVFGRSLPNSPTSVPPHQREDEEEGNGDDEALFNRILNHEENNNNNNNEGDDDEVLIEAASQNSNEAVVVLEEGEGDIGHHQHQSVARRRRQRRQRNGNDEHDDEEIDDDHNYSFGISNVNRRGHRHRGTTNTDGEDDDYDNEEDAENMYYDEEMPCEEEEEREDEDEETNENSNDLDEREYQDEENDEDDQRNQPQVTSSRRRRRRHRRNGTHGPEGESHIAAAASAITDNNENTDDDEDDDEEQYNGEEDEEEDSQLMEGDDDEEDDEELSHQDDDDDDSQDNINNQEQNDGNEQPDDEAVDDDDGPTVRMTNENNVISHHQHHLRQPQHATTVANSSRRARTHNNNSRSGRNHQESITTQNVTAVAATATVSTTVNSNSSPPAPRRRIIVVDEQQHEDDDNNDDNNNIPSNQQPQHISSSSARITNNNNVITTSSRLPTSSRQSQSNLPSSRNGNQTHNNNNSQQQFQGVLFDAGVLIGVVPLSQPEWSIEMVIKPTSIINSSSSSNINESNSKQILACCSFGASCDQLVLWMEKGAIFWGFPTVNSTSNKYYQQQDVSSSVSPVVSLQLQMPSSSSRSPQQQQIQPQQEEHKNIKDVFVVLPSVQQQKRAIVNNNNNTNSQQQQQQSTTTATQTSTHKKSHRLLVPYLRVVATWSRGELILTVGERQKDLNQTKIRSLCVHSNKLSPSSQSISLLSPSHTPSTTAMLGSSLRAVWSFGAYPDGSCCLASAAIVKKITLFNCCEHSSGCLASSCDTSSSSHHHLDSFDSLSKFIAAVRCVFETHPNNNNNNLLLHQQQQQQNQNQSNHGTNIVRNETESGVVLDVVGSLGWVPAPSVNHAHQNSSSNNKFVLTHNHLHAPIGIAKEHSMNSSSSLSAATPSSTNKIKIVAPTSPLTSKPSNNSNTPIRQAIIITGNSSAAAAAAALFEERLIQLKQNVDTQLQEPPYPELDFSSPLDPPELFVIDETNDIIRQQQQRQQRDGNLHPDYSCNNNNDNSFLVQPYNYFHPTTTLPATQDISAIHRQLKQVTPDELCQITNYVLSISLWRQVASIVVKAANKILPRLGTDEQNQNDAINNNNTTSTTTTGVNQPLLEKYFGGPSQLAPVLRRIVEALADTRPEIVSSLCNSVSRLLVHATTSSCEKEALTRHLLAEFISVASSPLEGMTFESPTQPNNRSHLGAPPPSEPPREVFVPHSRSYDVYFDRNINTGKVAITFYTDHTLNKICARSSGYPLRLRTFRFCFDVRWDESLYNSSSAASNLLHQWGYRITICTGVRKRAISVKMVRELVFSLIMKNNNKISSSSLSSFNVLLSPPLSSTFATVAMEEKLTSLSPQQIAHSPLLVTLSKLIVRNVSFLRRESCNLLIDVLKFISNNNSNLDSNHHHTQLQLALSLLHLIQKSPSMLDVRKMLERQHRRESTRRIYSRFVSSLFGIFVEFKETETNWKRKDLALVKRMIMMTATTAMSNNDSNATASSFSAQRQLATKLYNERTLAGAERVFLEDVKNYFSSKNLLSNANINNSGVRVESNTHDQTWTAWCESPGVVPVVLLGKGCNLSQGKWYFEIKLLTSNVDIFLGMVRSPSSNDSLPSSSQQQEHQLHDIFGFENGSYRLGTRCVSAAAMARSLLNNNNNNNLTSSSSTRQVHAKAKDVIGVAINIDEGYLCCTLNGVLYPKFIPLRHLQYPPLTVQQSPQQQLQPEHQNNTDVASCPPPFACPSSSPKATAIFFPLTPAIGISGYKEGISVNFGSAPFEFEPPTHNNSNKTVVVASPSTATNSTSNNNGTYFPLEPTSLTSGPLLPLNVLRAFVDASKHLLSSLSSSQSTSGAALPLPPFFNSDMNIFESVKESRIGPAQTSLFVAPGSLTNIASASSATPNNNSTNAIANAIVKSLVVPEASNETNCFVTVVADCLLTGKGKWYYECTLKTNGLMQIGWCVPAKFILTNNNNKSNDNDNGGGAEQSLATTNPSLGVGDDTFSIGIDLFRRVRWFGGARETLSFMTQQSPASILSTNNTVRRWCAGDIIGTSIDFDSPQGKVAFTLNGQTITEVTLKSIGFDPERLEKLRTELKTNMNVGVSPAFSLRPGNSVSVNFGSRPQKYKPEGFRAMSVPDGLLERIESHYKTLEEEEEEEEKSTTTTAKSSPSSSSSSLSLLLSSLESSSRKLPATIRDLINKISSSSSSSASSSPSNDGNSSKNNTPTLLLINALKLYDRLVHNALPLIDLCNNNNSSSSISSSSEFLTRIVLASRPLMLPSTRTVIANWWLKETSSRGEDLRLALNRTIAIKRQQQRSGGGGAKIISNNGSNNRGNNNDSQHQNQITNSSNVEDPFALKTLFGQTFSLLRNSVHPRALRTADPQRAWAVVFVGEGAEDVGGPFREHVSSMCNELMTGFAVPLFIPSPNGTHNVGSRRDAVTVNPFFVYGGDDHDAKIEDHVDEDDDGELTTSLFVRRDMFRFLGMLLGVAIRESEPLSLTMTTYFWKSLCREVDIDVDSTETLLSELESFDVGAAQSFKKILEIASIGDKDLFDDSFGFGAFPFRTILLSNGETYDIVSKKVVSAHEIDSDEDDDDDVVDDENENDDDNDADEENFAAYRANTNPPAKITNEDKFLTFENAARFVRLAAQGRLREIHAAVDACRCGLLAVVPAATLYLLGSADLELRICGRPDYTSSELKFMTVFESIPPDDTRVANLWKFIDEVSPQHRRLFLRFVSGRERLPVKLKVLPMNTAKDGNESSDADMLLPRAATCFFALELPLYSCYSVFKTKLLYAISNCWEIDTDFRARDLEGEGMSPQLTIGGFVHHQLVPTTTTTTQHHHHTQNTTTTTTSTNNGNNNNNNQDGASTSSANNSHRSSPTNML